ncbi:hypothetical protein MUK42_35702, partial [Musa troglodytarum]
KELRERERERGLWTRVWIPFLPTKQHSNLCCALMAALGCAHDNESITHHTESREEGVPFPSNFRQLHRPCVYTSRLLHHKKTLSPSHATVCNTYQGVSPIQNRACLEQQQRSTVAILRVLDPHCR